MGDFENKEREEVFSKKVRAGKRTYFFDVKATRSNDYYVTITESKKRFEDGQFIKHKIFLYKEDFEKFAEGLTEVVDYIKANQEVIEKRYEPNPEDAAYESNEYAQKDDYSF
ncbi:uncharacterized protein DUF3276 [Sphingobacterium allocomposti]|uniref:Uncharacterized protein DUF3276 n=1 Tax=Sphingobacterium allocomposti TaxID=415956 RepID=A0A5S5DBQ6_9SPHI|nr:DUF3276 family protein [Sphingobacterium composti Yoo et al. 2007 non Ten et al. 2007]TYP93135.1 uncharacterized protein DUF3276 [Sphingobacterium composti Yoo et al. 2007 non Ten et al. 2007]